jgi:hypothetical protein
MNKYRYKMCPRCQQDALYVMQRRDDGELFLHCEECEWAWTTLEAATTIEKGFLGLDIEATYATSEAITKAGWDKYGLDVVDG